MATNPPPGPSAADWAAASAATLALGLLVFLPMPRPVRPFWSLFFFAEYPWPLRLLLVLAPLALLGALRPVLARLAAGPVLAGLAARPAGTAAAGAASRGASRLWPLLLAAGSFALFWLLRERRHWGDAAYTVAILEGTADVSPLGRFFWKEPLDRLLAMLFVRLGGRLGLDTASSVALMSAFAGALFVAALWSCSARLARGGASRLFVFAFVLAAGGSQLFFGHVENYTLVTLCMLLFLREGLAVTQGEGSIARAGLLAALALTAHPLAGFLVVPLVALPFLRPSPADPAALARFALAMVPGTAYLVGFYALCRALGAPALELGANRFGETGRVFLGPGEAFTARHLWDVLQNYLLTLPAGAAVVLLQRLGERRRGGGRDRAALLLLSASLSLLVFALFLLGTLRRRRDWDLFAPASLPVALLAARLFARRLDGGRATLALGAFLVLFSLAVSGAWILSNHLHQPAP